jgi:hypothetical protein
MPRRGLNLACWVSLVQRMSNFGIILIIGQNYFSDNLWISPLQSGNKDNQLQEVFHEKLTKGSLPLEERYHC